MELSTKERKLVRNLAKRGFVHPLLQAYKGPGGNLTLDLCRVSRRNFWQNCLSYTRTIIIGYAWAFFVLATILILSDVSFTGENWVVAKVVMIVGGMICGAHSAFWLLGGCSSDDISWPSTPSSCFFFDDIKALCEALDMSAEELFKIRVATPQEQIKFEERIENVLVHRAARRLLQEQDVSLPGGTMNPFR